MIEKAVKRVLFVAYLVRKVPWAGLRRLRDRRSDTVVWIHHRYPAGWIHYVLREDTVLNDAALLNALVESGTRFRLVFGNRIGREINRRVLYSIGAFNPAGVRDYSASMMATLRQLEEQGNVLYPSADEAEFWENKAFMHRRFDELGINCPPTVLVDRHDDLREDAQTYPLLVKEPHSCGSEGLHKVEGPTELVRLRGELADRGDHEILVQQLVDMRRDLRVTIVGDEVVLSYFRINLSDEWRPTATSRGSNVDFESFPEQWRSHLVDILHKLGLRTGAFDVCWEHDDLETEPIILEVSPAYRPNPVPPASFKDRPYADFKHELWGSDAYHKRHVDLVFDIHRKVLAVYGFPPKDVPATST